TMITVWNGKKPNDSIIFTNEVIFTIAFEGTFTESSSFILKNRLGKEITDKKGYNTVHTITTKKHVYWNRNILNTEWRDIATKGPFLVKKDKDTISRITVTKDNNGEYILPFNSIEEAFRSGTYYK
ncbi:MAG: hypothetical protein ACRCTJ_01375, partial [Brevinema sp.]